MPLPKDDQSDALRDQSHETVSEETSSLKVDFSSWQDKFSQFAKSEKRHSVPPVSHTQPGSREGTGTFDGIAEVQKFRMEWAQFLDMLLKKNHKVIVTHLRSCELASFSDGILYMSCSRRFSYEELQHNADMLAAEMREFYNLPLKLQISHDAENDAGKGQTVFTFFSELAEKNDIVKFLVDEFGGELIY